MRFFKVVLLCLIAISAIAAPIPRAAAQTQEQTGPNYAAWEKAADAAESSLQKGDLATAGLEKLRAELANWREQFLGAQSVNDERIKTIKSQITSLGPLPADGATEPEEIAQRRRGLNEQLARLEAPVRTAVEAYSRADGLIKEIDTDIRERQASELMKHGPSPFAPAAIAEAARSLSDSAAKVSDEVATALDGTLRQDGIRELPRILGYLFVALILLTRSRKWMEDLSLRIQRRTSSNASSITGLVVSLGQIVLPMVGVFILVQAVRATGVFGTRSDAILQILPVAGFIALLARWLGGQVFSKVEQSYKILNLPKERRREGRTYASLLGVLMATGMIVNTIVPGVPTDASFVVINFPFLVLVALILFRLGQLMRAHVRNDTPSGEDKSYRNRVIGVIGRVAMLVGVVGPVLAAVGYFSAATAFVTPTIVSLALLALLALLQRFFVDLYTLIGGQEERASDSLVPFMIGFTLLMLSLPLFALVWGARVADLTELWARFREGFSYGDTRISPTDFITFAAVFAIGYMLTRLVQGVLRTAVLPKTHIDTGGRNAIVSGTGYIGVFLAGLLAITTAGIDLSSLAIVAGALSVGIGFGLQNIVSNFVSGIILLIERPISEGDWIEVGGRMGYVRDISVRSTRIETFDRTDVIVPNADLVSGVVTNWTRGNLTGRVIVPVGVAYGSDTKKVEAVLREIAEAHPMVSLNPPPNVLFRTFGADSLDFEIRAILRDVNWSVQVTSDMNHEIARRFSEEGIEIPFAQRDIWIRNPEALGGGAKKDESQ